MPLPSTHVVHPNRAAEVASTLAGTKPDLAVIARPTSSKSAAGGDTEVFGVIASAVPVRIRAQGRRSRAAQAGGQEAELTKRELSFADGTDVKPRDRVYVGARTFDVEEAAAESYDAELRCLCVEVTG